MSLAIRQYLYTFSFWRLIFILGSIGVIALLILISGAFSAMEIALSSSNRTKVKISVESGDERAKQLLNAIEDPSSFFATTQLYITFITLFLGTYAANSFTAPLVYLLLAWGVPVSAAVAEFLVFIFITVALTYFALVFGEMVPKQIALRKGMTFALAAIGLLNLLSRAVLPFVKLLSISANFVLKLLGAQEKIREEEVTKEEILMMLKSGTEHGNIAESGHDIMNNVLELDERTIEDACVHRINVVALPLEAEIKEVLGVLANEKFSRVPIYEESIDNIVGILHIKDMMKYIVDNPDTSGFDIKKLMREPYFVPSFKRADELLHEMRKNCVHIAVVVDEYGGTVGILTMEDLVEEFVGNIFDEYDEETPDIIPVDDGAFIIQGTTNLRKVQEHFDITLPLDEHDTLSGFLIGQLRRIPAEDEKPELMYGNLLFKIESVLEKRIEKTRVFVLPKEPGRYE